MASKQMGNKPALTGTTLQKMANNHFGTRYEIYASSLPGADFWIKSSAVSGMLVKVKQKNNGTVINYNRAVPSTLIRGLFAGGWMFILFGSGKNIEKDFAAFLDTAPELK